MKAISAGLVLAVLAASFICWIAQDPSTMVAILPVAIRFFEFSQLVVVGSFSMSPLAAMSYSRESAVYFSWPAVHGASLLLIATSALGSPVKAPMRPCGQDSGQPVSYTHLRAHETD